MNIHLIAFAVLVVNSIATNRSNEGVVSLIVFRITHINDFKYWPGAAVYDAKTLLSQLIVG